MTTSLEQKKLIACAELDGRLEEFESLIKQKYFLLMTETLLRENRFNYHISLDAIVPVVIKWCGDDNRKKSKFEFELCEILYKAKVSNVINTGIIKSDYLLLPTPSQIRDALLLAAGKMPVE